MMRTTMLKHLHVNITFISNSKFLRIISKRLDSFEHRRDQLHEISHIYCVKYLFSKKLF